MKEIRDIMSREQAAIPLRAHLKAMPGELPVLTLADPQGRRVSVTGEAPVDTAQQRALDQAGAMKQLGKTGGTPYVLAELTLESGNAFMTAGMLNALRRDALEAMRQARIRVVREKKEGVCRQAEIPPTQRKLIVQGENLRDAQALLDSGADEFLWQPQCYQRAFLEKEIASACPGVKPVFVLPAVTYTQQLDALHAFVCDHAQAFGGVQLNNVGQFERPWPVPVSGGQGLNVMNSDAARFFEALGAGRLTASCELTYRELLAMIEKGGNFEIEAYGRTQMMLLSHCPKRTLRGDEVHNDACNACAASGGCPDVYTDRMGYRFPLRRLKMEHGCVLRLLNSVTTDVIRELERNPEIPCSIRLSFIDEPLSRQKQIIASYRSVLRGGKPLHEIEPNATSGHWRRSVK